MQVVIATNGTYLHERQGLFEIKTPEKRVELSPAKVTSIVLGSAATVSTGAVRLAVQNNIDILFLDRFGDPFARAWHCGFGSIAAIRRAQMQWALSDEGGAWIARQIADKIEEQAGLLDELVRRRAGQGGDIPDRVNRLRQIAQRVLARRGTPSDIRQDVFALEAHAGKVYFDSLSEIVPAAWKFEGRSRRPAKDGFNAFLNYAYGVLYGVVDRATVLAGLDPHLGLLHTDNYGRPSLVFDLVEPYRAWMDRVVVGLFAARRAQKEMLREVPGGYALEKAGKSMLLTALNEYLDEIVRLDHRQRSRRIHIQARLHKLANGLIGRGDTETEVTEL